MGQVSQHEITNFTDSSGDRFRYLSNLIVQYGKSTGVRIIPYLKAELPIYSGLPEMQKVKIIHALECFVKICQDCLAMGGSLSESKTFIWCALKELRLRPNSELFSFLENDQVIEIYNLEQVQIFRNFKFFEYISYTLEDLFCRQRYEMFRRPDENIAKSMESGLMHVLQNPHLVVQNGVPAHEVEEIDSIFKFKFNADIKYASALVTPESSVSAFIVMEEVELTYQPSAQEQERLLSLLYKEELSNVGEVIQLYQTSELT